MSTYFPQGSLIRSLSSSRNRLASVLRQFLPGGRLVERDLDDLEEALIGADVAVKTAEELLQVVRGGHTDSGSAREMLIGAMVELLEAAEAAEADLPRPITGPMIVLLVGVNGSGKTTTAAKLARWVQVRGQTPILGAADTFRAAAVEQLQGWGRRLNVRVIAHPHGGDPAAVAFDTCEAVVAQKADTAIIDTAGRLQTHSNLMYELGKIRRVITRVVENAPHEVLLVLDGTTGQNGLHQAEEFLQHAGVTGLVLAKLDGTAKGGVALTIAHRLALPIRFVGTGEGAEDLASFDAAGYVEALIGETKA